VAAGITSLFQDLPGTLASMALHGSTRKTLQRSSTVHLPLGGGGLFIRERLLLPLRGNQLPTTIRSQIQPIMLNGRRGQAESKRKKKKATR
jgi:hypothetical protein